MSWHTSTNVHDVMNKNNVLAAFVAAKLLMYCQDYRYLNEFTKPNAYPLPLILDLMIKLKGSKYFTKLDIRWGYNNVCIKEGDEWKATFITNKGLFKPTVMFFGL